MRVLALAIVAAALGSLLAAPAGSASAVRLERVGGAANPCACSHRIEP